MFIFAGIFHIAKRRPPADVSGLISSTAGIADQYEKIDNKFATKLCNAAPNLFTFVNHPGMDPTNNEIERYMRPVIIRRNMWLHFTTKRNMDAWSIVANVIFS